MDFDRSLRPSFDFVHFVLQFCDPTQLYLSHNFLLVYMCTYVFVCLYVYGVYSVIVLIQRTACVRTLPLTCHIWIGLVPRHPPRSDSPRLSQGDEGEGELWPKDPEG